MDFGLDIKKISVQNLMPTVKKTAPFSNLKVRLSSKLETD